MLGNRHSQHSFAKIPDVKTARSQFDRSFTIKDTFDFDYLVPIFCDEILPGDTCNVNLNMFARLATQKVPIMDNLYIDFFFFFVPNRLVWNNWERFNGAQDDPGDTTDYVMPDLVFPAGGPEVGSIFDKFGLPTDSTAGYQIQCLPLRGYNLIWNEWFRDQNLQDSVLVSKDDGPDDVLDFTLLKRGKRHDYFTSCLPWPQKGPAVDLPLSGNIPVLRSSNAGSWTVYDGDTDTLVGAGDVVTNASGRLDYSVGPIGVSLNPSPGGTANPGLYAVLGEGVGPTINEFRQAMSMQALFELDARGGTRYVEILRSHFNVVSPDFRLQRPEYLGGGSSRINMHPVPQTSPTAGSNPQAQLASFGTASSTGGRIGFTKSFVEHGYVIGLACARADITYQQGLNRMWSRVTRYDFFWPKLAELGEQAVLYKELDINHATAGDAFGYQERYAEYRYKPSEIHGEFRSTYATSLDYWHMAEEFGTDPELNADFIEQSTPIERAITITTEPHLLFDAWFNYKHARPMPVYSVPATIGRF